MIAQVADLFVERRSRAPVAAVSAARRVLVVDATGVPARLSALFGALEARVAIRVGLVGAPQLDAVPPVDVFDAVWLFVDPSADRAYTELLAQELAERFAVAARIVAIGGESRDGWTVLDAGVAGGGLPWRRRRTLEAGAAELASLAGCHAAESTT